MKHLKLPFHLRRKYQTAEKYQGSANHGGLDLHTVVNRWLQINYVNPVLYPVSVSTCPSSGHGVLCICIGDLISKMGLILFTPLSASKAYFENHPVIYNCIKCS